MARDAGDHTRRWYNETRNVSGITVPEREALVTHKPWLKAVALASGIASLALAVGAVAPMLPAAASAVTTVTMDMPTTGYIGAIYNTLPAQSRTCSLGAHPGVDIWTARTDPTNGGQPKGNPVFLTYPGRLVARLTDSRGAVSGVAFYHPDIRLYTLYLGMAEEISGESYVDPTLGVDATYARGRFLGNQGNRAWLAGDPVAVRLHFAVTPLPSPDFGIDPSPYLGLQLDGCGENPVPLSYAVVAGGTPDAPTPVSPAAGARVAARVVTFAWSAPASEVDQYVVRAADSAEELDYGPWLGKSLVPATTLTTTLTLPSDGLFWWAVWSCRGCEAGTPVYSDRSEARDLTVDTTPPNGPPGVPTLLSPADGTASHDDSSPLLIWRSSGDPDGGPLEFYAEVTGASLWNSGWITATAAQPSGLGRGGYTWRVRARDSKDALCEWTPAWHFTVEGKPSAPTNLGVTSRTLTAISLSWSDNSNQPHNNEEQFVIYRNGVKVGRTGQNVTAYADSGLPCDTPYTYTVRAYHSLNGLSDPSNVLATRTVGCSECPDPYEPNGDFAHATGITFGQDVPSYICTTTDEDYWAIVVPSAPGRMVLDLYDLPSGSDYDLYFYSPQRAELAVSRRSGTQNEHIAMSVYQAGTYYARVVGFGGSHSILLAYHLRVNAQLGNTPPTVGTVTPDSGTGRAMDLTTFTATYGDPDGWPDIKIVYFLVRQSLGSARDGVLLAYNRQLNRLFLRNDADTLWLGGQAPGTPGTAESSRAVLDTGQCQVTASGDTLSLKLALRFKYAMEGTWRVYLLVADLSGAVQGYTQRGTWNIVIVSEPPVIGAITPTGSYIPPDTWTDFTSVVSDHEGFADIDIAYMLVISPTGSVFNGVYLAYNRRLNRVFLRNDNSTAWLGGQSPGTSAVVENSRVRLDLANCRVVGSGQILTVTYALQFKPGFVGDKVLLAAAQDMARRVTGFQKRGTWTVGSVPFMEAEVGVVQAPIIVAADPLASAGQYIIAPPGTAWGDGSLTLQLQVFTMGHYRLEARVWAANYTSDSFFVKVDNTTEIQWSFAGARNEWHWEGPPQQFGLIPGLHTIRFRTREAGAKLDAIRLILVP